YHETDIGSTAYLRKIILIIFFQIFIDFLDLHGIIMIKMVKFFTSKVGPAIRAGLPNSLLTNHIL
ncbi:MAG: hypothetical protein Q4C66_11950, partial [Lachnospiraceae bacterium]|nr:hypothetical protein [Lachnospiraceae bacterium]